MSSRSISNLNKFLDTWRFDKYKRLRKEITNVKKDPLFYDYGEGYFYQSLSKINLRGLRNTIFRKNKLKIEKISKDKNILDIGTNTGFLLMEMENNFNKALGIDHNPSLIEIANKVKKFLDIQNVSFKCRSIYDLETTIKYDIILSLANHSTFDEGIKDTKKYFSKILELIKPNGILILESHHPDYENLNNFEKIYKEYLDDFEILEEGTYFINNYFDNKRKYLKFKLK